MVSVFRPVSVLNLSQKLLKRWRLWRHFWRKFLWERTFVEFDKLLLAPFGELVWLPWLRVELMTIFQRYGRKPRQAQQTVWFEDWFHFESSEQAWAALLWAMEIKDAAIFWKLGKPHDSLPSAGVTDYFGFARRRWAEQAWLLPALTWIPLLQAESLRQAQGKKSTHKPSKETYP